MRSTSFLEPNTRPMRWCRLLGRTCSLHQRIGLVFGSKNEVERIERYHAEPAQKESNTPLFAERSLFRD